MRVDLRKRSHDSWEAESEVERRSNTAVCRLRKVCCVQCSRLLQVVLGADGEEEARKGAGSALSNVMLSGIALLDGG